MYWLGWFKSLSSSAVASNIYRETVLLERVGDQRQDLLVLIQQQHCAQIAQSLVRKARGGQQLQTFDLAEMGALAQGEEIEELGDIVSPAAV